MQPANEGASFGALLRAHRLSLGLTQELLAERAGLSRRGIADLERGARLAPYGHTIERLAAALTLSDAQRQELVHAINRAPVPRQPRLRVVPTGAPSLLQDAPRRQNLPVRPSSFVGRHRERSALATLLVSSPLTTVVGPGGIGKTRLALEVSATLVELMRDGVWLVDLAPLNDPTLVPQAVAAILGVQQRSEVDLTGSLASWLRSKRMLLILDNCEHVLEACAHLASQLIHSCPELRLLATSREIFGIEGETIFRVDPLDVGDGAESVVESDAATLFVDRARSVAPGFRLTNANGPAVASLCRRLDGMPLALELAAARMRAMTLEDVAQRLGQRFDLLTNGFRDVLPRHRTLKALVDWSYDLLNNAERAMFQRLSVFTGAWTLDAAESVCGVGPGTTLDLLSQLVDKSLVQTEPQPSGALRYRMLETLRHYAAERLHESGEAEIVQRNHAMFFAEVLHKRWGRVAYGYEADTADRLASVERDYDNFRLSLRWLVDHSEWTAAERLAQALIGFWALGGRVEEGRVWLTELLELQPRSDVPSRARLRLGQALAQLEALGGNRAAAYDRLQALMPAIREYSDAPTLALALGLAASLTRYVKHDLDTARSLALEGLSVAETTHITPVEAMTRERLASIASDGGDYALAEQLLTQNIAGAEPNRPRAITFLAQVRFRQGNFAAAAALLDDLLNHISASHSPLEVVLASTVLSWARLAQGNIEGALEAGRRALALVHENLGRTTSFGNLPEPLEALAMVAAAAGQPERALRLAAIAAMLRQSYKEELGPADNAVLERWLTPARSAVGHQASAAIWAAGKSLRAEAAIADALQLATALR